MELIGRVVGGPARDTGKVTVVGAGSVGIAAAYAILIKGFGNPLVLLDELEDKVSGEVKDLQQGTSFLGTGAVIGGTDYGLSEGSRVCVIAAGRRQSPGQDRLSLLEDNVSIVRNVLSQLVRYSPEAVYVIATNPVDALTYAAWRTSNLPLNRIFGTGTHLDSSRFKHYISETIGIPVGSIEAFVVGEHGESSVAVWSSVRLAGQSLSQFDDLLTNQEQEDIHKKVTNSAQEVISLKGYTSLGIGLAIADIVDAILSNKDKIMCVSTRINDEFGVEKDTFASLPCMIGGNGINQLVAIQLSDEENQKLTESVRILMDAQDEIENSLNVD